MTSTEEEPKTKKQRTSTEASTHATSSTTVTTTTKLDSLPSEDACSDAARSGQLDKKR